MTQKKKPTGKKGSGKGKKKSIVYYPDVITNPQTGEHEYVMSEAELDYEDRMLAVKMGQLAKKGLTNEQIIDILPISRDTFYGRLRSDPYFSYALNKYRGLAKEQVENAMFNSALGFHYKEEQATPLGVFEVKKYALPNVSAQKEWLYNRAPDEWRRKNEVIQANTTDISALNVTLRRREE